MSNITQVVNTDKNLKTLKKGMHASDLDQLLSSTGPFTFFAPSDTAFEKLDAGTVESLLEPANKIKLTDLMHNHVVNGKISFNELKDGDVLKTIGGQDLLVHVTNGSVTIGDSHVHARDAKKISNGIIHMMDTVMAK